MQFVSLVHRLLSDLRSDKYSLSCDQKPTHFAYMQSLFHNHLTNISRIANLNAGGDRAAKAEQFTY